MPCQIALSRLEDKLTMVYIDTRDSGQSTRPADRSRMSQVHTADNIEQFRKKLGVEQVDLQTILNRCPVAAVVDFHDRAVNDSSYR